MFGIGNSLLTKTYNILRVTSPHNVVYSTFLMLLNGMSTYFPSGTATICGAVTSPGGATSDGMATGTWAAFDKSWARILPCGPEP